MPDRQKFVRSLAQIAEAGESFAANGTARGRREVSAAASAL